MSADPSAIGLDSPPASIPLSARAKPQTRFQFLVAEGEAAWTVTRVELSEALNEPFRLQVWARCEDAMVELRRSLGQHAELLLLRDDLAVRRVCGQVCRVRETSTRAERVSAQFTVVPALARLGDGRDSFIHQDKTAVDIAEAVLGRGLSPHEREVDVSGLSDIYPVRETCVQYQESDLDFVSRLLAEEGIGYRFEFPEDEAERIVLFDSSADLPEAPTADGGPLVYTTHAAAVPTGVEPLVSFEEASSLATEGLTLRDYEWTRRGLTVEAEVGADPSMEAGVARYEVGHGAGTTHSDYDAGVGRYGESDVERQAKLRYELARRDVRVLRGVTQALGLSPGQRFSVAGHPSPDLDGEYLVVRASLFGGLGEEPPEDARLSESLDLHSPHVSFECIPFDTPYRPDRKQQKPAILGVQTALVSSGDADPLEPSGDVHCDQHGRIRVRFHWDRREPTAATAYVRVAQTWAGSDGRGRPGFLFLPRVGSEVVVTFLDGDPDRPLVTGQVWNATQLPTDLLPDMATRSAIRTQSLGKRDGYNELSFEDAGGREEVYLRAERNLRVKVKNDNNKTVGGDQTLKVKKERQIVVEGNQTVTVHKVRLADVFQDDITMVGGHRDVLVHQYEDHHVKGYRKDTVDGNVKYMVGGSCDESTSLDYTSTVGNDCTESVYGESKLNVLGGHTIDVKGQCTLNIGDYHSVKVQGPIMMETPQTITAKAREIMLEGESSVTVKAPKGLEQIATQQQDDVAEAAKKYLKLDTFSQQSNSGAYTSRSYTGVGHSFSGFSQSGSLVSKSDTVIDLDKKEKNVESVAEIRVLMATIVIIG